MPTVKQVLEQYEKDPKEIIGRILAVIDDLYTRLNAVETALLETGDLPENWDKEETHLS